MIAQILSIGVLVGVYGSNGTGSMVHNYLLLPKPPNALVFGPSSVLFGQLDQVKYDYDVMGSMT